MSDALTQSTHRQSLVNGFSQLKSNNWMTDSIVVPKNLCPAYAVSHSHQTHQQLMRESSVQKPQQRGLEMLMLGSMLALITLVSMIDVYWSFKTQAVLAETEQNPIGKWLIARDGGDISLFMTLKMAGTMGVILSIPALYFFRRSWGIVCASALSLFQCGLLAYFYWGHQWFPAA